MEELGRITCPACGANLGPSSETGEYRCAFCGDVSHQGRLRPVYGALGDIVGSWERDAQREAQAAEDSLRRAREEDEARALAAADRTRALRRTLVIVAVICVALILAVLALAR